MLALAAIVLAGAQATPAQAWEHTLIRRERYEELEAGTGHLAWLDTQFPLALRPKRHELWSPDHPFFAGGRGEGDDPEDGIARYESPVIDIAGGFEEAWPSWNVTHRPSTGVSFELRVGRAQGDVWSPWLHVASVGTFAVPFARQVRFEGNVVQPVFDARELREFVGGHIELDHFVSDELWDRVQYAVRARTNADSDDVRVRRVVLCASRRSSAALPQTLAPVRAEARRRLPLTTYGGHELASDQRESMSLLMSSAVVTKYRCDRGLLAEMVEHMKEMHLDPMRSLTPAAIVHFAYRAGAPGYVARFADWSEAEDAIADGQPLVLRVERATGATRDATWLVLEGFDEGGNALVMDPLAPEGQQVEHSISRDELTRTWLATGGLACVFLPVKEK